MMLSSLFLSVAGYSWHVGSNSQLDATLEAARCAAQLDSPDNGAYFSLTGDDLASGTPLVQFPNSSSTRTNPTLLTSGPLRFHSGLSLGWVSTAAGPLSQPPAPTCEGRSAGEIPLGVSDSNANEYSHFMAQTIREEYNPDTGTLDPTAWEIALGGSGPGSAQENYLAVRFDEPVNFAALFLRLDERRVCNGALSVEMPNAPRLEVTLHDVAGTETARLNPSFDDRFNYTSARANVVAFSTDCDDMPIKEIRLWSPGHAPEDGWTGALHRVDFRYAAPAISTEVVASGNSGTNNIFVAGADTIEFTIGAVNSGPVRAEEVVIFVAIDTDTPASELTSINATYNFTKLDEEVAFRERCYDSFVTYFWQVPALEPDEEARIDVVIEVDPCERNNTILAVFAAPYSFQYPQILGDCDVNGLNCDNTTDVETNFFLPRDNTCATCSSPTAYYPESTDMSNEDVCPESDATLCEAGCGALDFEQELVVAEVTLNFTHTAAPNPGPIVAGSDSQSAGNLNYTTTIINEGPSCLGDRDMAVEFALTLGGAFVGNFGGVVQANTTRGFEGILAPGQWYVNVSEPFSDEHSGGEHEFFAGCSECEGITNMRIKSNDVCTSSSTEDLAAGTVTDSSSSIDTTISSDTTDEEPTFYAVYNDFNFALDTVPVCSLSLCYNKENATDDDRLLIAVNQYQRETASLDPDVTFNGTYLSNQGNDCDCVTIDNVESLAIFARTYECNAETVFELFNVTLECEWPYHRFYNGSEYLAYGHANAEGEYYVESNTTNTWYLPEMAAGEGWQLLQTFAVEDTADVGLLSSNATLVYSDVVDDADRRSVVLAPTLPSTIVVDREVVRELSLVLGGESIIAEEYLTQDTAFTSTTESSSSESSTDFVSTPRVLNEVLVAGAARILDLSCESPFTDTSPTDGTGSLSLTSINSTMSSHEISSESGFSSSSRSDGESSDTSSFSSTSYNELTTTISRDIGLGNLIHTITLQNTGPSEGTGIVIDIGLVSDVDANVEFVRACASDGTIFDFSTRDWIITDLEACENVTLEILYYVNPCAEEAVRQTTAVFQTSVEALTAGDLGAESVVSAVAETEINRVPEISVEVLISDEETRVVAGCSAPAVNYTVRVHNSGPSCASDVVAGVLFEPPAFGVAPGANTSNVAFSGFAPVTNSDNLVGTLGPIAVMQPGESAVLEFAVIVEEEALPSFDAINTSASLLDMNEAIEDQDEGDDADWASLHVYGLANLLISKTANVNPVVAGSGAGNLVHTVQVSHAAEAGEPYLPAVGVVVKDRYGFVEEGITLDAIAPSASTFHSEEHKTIEWEVGAVNPGESFSLELTYTVDSSAAVGADSIINEAEIVSAELPEEGLVCPGPLRNTDDDVTRVSTDVIREVALSFEPVVGERTITQGTRKVTELAVSAVLENSGPSDAAAVAVQLLFDLPKGTVVEELAVSNGVLTSTHPTASEESLWVVPLQSGEEAHIRATLRSYDGGRVVLTAQVDEHLSEEALINAGSGSTIGWTVSRKLEAGRTYE